MSKTSFEDRLARLRQKEMQSQPAMPQMAGGPQPSLPDKAGNRRERLHLALAHLERGGVTGSYAYAPAFRALAGMGIILKPLHYRSWIGLILFFVILMTFLTGLATVMAVVIDAKPRWLRAVYQHGPIWFFGLTTAAGIGFAAVHKIKAAEIGLPRWRDL